MKQGLTAALYATPEAGLPMITYVKSLHIQALVTKPVIAKLIKEIVDNGLDKWLLSIYVTIALDHDVETELMKYYKLCATVLDSNNNLGLDDVERSLQHVTLEQIIDISEQHIYLKPLQLLKCKGIV